MFASGLVNPDGMAFQWKWLDNGGKMRYRAWINNEQEGAYHRHTAIMQHEGVMWAIGTANPIYHFAYCSTSGESNSRCRIHYPNSRTWQPK